MVHHDVQELKELSLFERFREHISDHVCVLFPVKMASRPSCAGALREDTEDTGGFVVVVVV